MRGYELATSSDEQQVIQALIDSATPNECQKLRSQAEEILGEIHARMRLRLHPSSTVKAGQSVSLAIAGRDCRALAG